MINLVNYSGEPQRPYDQIVPVHNIKVSIAAQLAPSVQTASLLWSRQTVPLRRQDTRWELQIPQLDVLECIVIKSP